MQIAIKYVNTSQTRSERLRMALGRLKPIDWALIVLGITAIGVSMIDLYMARSLLSAIFHGL